MTCVSAEVEIEHGVVRPPWETAPLGVVSLLEMLEFAARDYIELTHQLGLYLASAKAKQTDSESLGRGLEKLLEETNRLGLLVTRDQIGGFFMEALRTNPSRVENLGERRVRVNFDAIPESRLYFHLECIYATLKAELGTIKLKAIQPQKSKYCEPKWLFDSPIYSHFPNAWKEFQSSGRCYAYGENTACAFHLNRALEWGLKSLAVHLERRFDRHCWEKHLEDIERELKVRYGSAGPRTAEEKFYSEAAAQFGNMKVAWRNPTMHIEAKYDETEAAYLLATIEQFMTHLADNDLKEPNENVQT